MNFYNFFADELMQSFPSIPTNYIHAVEYCRSIQNYILFANKLFIAYKIGLPQSHLVRLLSGSFVTQSYTRFAQKAQK